MLWNLINQELQRDRENNAFRTYEKTAYYLGLCYQKLRIYKKAYYYLSVNATSSNYTYVRTFVDCLVQAKDYRANRFVQHYIKQMQEAIQKAEWNDIEVPESSTEFLNHLRKLDVRLEIDFGDILTAESTLKEMLQEEDMADFAKQELEFLKTLRLDTKTESPKTNKKGSKSN